MSSCSYCGLPTGAGLSQDKTSGIEREESVYCCLGCRIADGILRGAKDEETEWSATRLGIAIFFTMNVMVFTLALWSWNVHELGTDSRVHAFREILRYACLFFSVPVVLLLGIPLAESAWEAIRKRSFTTDILLLAGVVAAFTYSLTSLWFSSADVYFEVCCMILVAVTLGKWLEGTAKQKATQAIRSLRDLLPKQVRLVNASGESGETTVATEHVQVGACLRVLPGERIPLDGHVLQDGSEIDEQFVTGESHPVWKGPGATVHAGSLNLSHELRMIVDRPADAGTIARLLRAVEAATSTACQTTRVADSLAAWFVPIIATASLGTLAYHWQSGIQHALMAAISVVLIACPCALGIATPLALWVAIHSAARRGVVFRNGDAVIRLAKLRTLGLDKTGTITNGELNVVDQVVAHDTPMDVVTHIAHRLANTSDHPVSRALCRRSEQDTDNSSQDIQFEPSQSFPGQGIIAHGTLAGRPITAFLGSLAFARANGLALPKELEQAAARLEEFGTACVGWNGSVRAIFFLADTPREESSTVLSRLRKLGLDLVILTGDRNCRASQIENSTGVPAVGELLPEQKAAYLQDCAGPVGMVGDGLNDALSLATVDVGIAMDCGADVTRESADVCLMGSTLTELPGIIELSRATQRAIRHNLFWAVGYNVLGVGFAITGNLNPIVAAVAMVGSSFFVLGNSLALSFQLGMKRDDDFDTTSATNATQEALNDQPQPSVPVASRTLNPSAETVCID